ncbi:MAG: hypothetical protein WC438_02485 [Candidatus Pacearchaeota archaeon]
MEKLKLKKIFLLSWKKTTIIIFSWLTSVLLHNLVSSLLNIEEAFFFIIATIIIPAYLIICVVYTLIIMVLKRKISKRKR